MNTRDHFWGTEGPRRMDSVGDLMVATCFKHRPKEQGKEVEEESGTRWMG